MEIYQHLFLIFSLAPSKLPVDYNNGKKNVYSSLNRFFTTTTKSLQSCPTLCNPIDSSPPGSPIPGILKARTLERVALSFSNA